MDRLVREKSIIPFPDQPEELGVGGEGCENDPQSEKDINSL
jgi:hypothetical protein